MKNKIRFLILAAVCCMLAGCGLNNKASAVQEIENSVKQQETSDKDVAESTTTEDATAEEATAEEATTGDATTEDVTTQEAEQTADEVGTDAVGAETTSGDTATTEVAGADVVNADSVSTDTTNTETLNKETANAEEAAIEATKTETEGTDMETKIIVYKSERRLELWQNGEKTQEYHIGLGKNPEGKKEQEGDKKTPEGEYYVCTKNQYSKFYLALGVSYPNIEDAQNGLDKGLIDQETFNTIKTAIENGQCPPWKTPLGGEIMIHGHGGSKDWTTGCIGVDDEVMDVLWEACEIGTKITIYP